jgi:hypothetical protein
MAPSVNLSDDVAAMSQCIGQLFRLAVAGRSPSQLEKAAAAAGLPAAQAGAFVRGEILLPPRQTITFASAVLEQARQQHAAYQAQIRQPHAGTDAMRGSYAGKVSETVTLPRGRSEDRVRLQGGPVETAKADVDATLALLETDFAGWRFTVDGAGTAKLVWSARHADQGQVHGATSLELAGKVQRIEDQAAADAETLQRYADGRGVTGRRP